jgi:hypothetical protein
MFDLTQAVEERNRAEIIYIVEPPCRFKCPMTCYLSTIDIFSTLSYSSRARMPKKKRRTCLDQPVGELIGPNADQARQEQKRRRSRSLIKARREARTHSLKIKSLTRYRLRQPGLFRCLIMRNFDLESIYRCAKHVRATTYRYLQETL